MNFKEKIRIQDLRVGYATSNQNGFSYPTINCNAMEAELIALVGRNGIGKSTLLRTIAKLQPILSGQIDITGQSIETVGLSVFARLVSFIPAEPVHSPNTTVADFVSLARYPYHGWFDSLNSNDEQAIENSLIAVNMLSYKHRFIDRLSDGERQRAMIAFAIAQDTPIILMDEPTAFLDLPNKFEVIRLLKEQSKLGKTVILSTHDLQTAFGLVDTIWLMLPDGIKVGAPEDIVLSGSLNQLMEETSVSFDLSTGQFLYRQLRSHAAQIAAEDNKLYQWTKHALERIGYTIPASNPDENSLLVEVTDSEGRVQWCLNQLAHKPTFDSLKDLCLFIKQL